MKCGNCKSDHDKVDEVRDCYAQSEHDEAEAKAEAEMERRVERFFEEGPHGPTPEDPRELEAQYMESLLRETATRLMEDEEAMAAQVLDKMTGAPGRDMASKAQIKYALDLLAGHVWPDVLTEHDLQNMERRQVSKLIGSLKNAPKKQGELNLDPEVGMYIERESQSIFRLYMGQRSGRVLAKRLMEHSDGYSYQYVGSAQTVMRRHELERMTLEEAKQFGRMSGMCVVCGRRLDVPESVEAGIGPVCSNKEW